MAVSRLWGCVTGAHMHLFDGPLCFSISIHAQVHGQIVTTFPLDPLHPSTLTPSIQPSNRSAHQTRIPTLATSPSLLLHIRFMSIQGIQQTTSVHCMLYRHPFSSIPRRTRLVLPDSTRLYPKPSKPSRAEFDPRFSAQASFRLLKSSGSEVKYNHYHSSLNFPTCT